MFIQDCLNDSENNISVSFYSNLQPDSQIVTVQISFSRVCTICKWYSLSHTIGRYVLRWHCLLMNLMSVGQLHHRNIKAVTCKLFTMLLKDQESVAW